MGLGWFYTDWRTLRYGVAVQKGTHALVGGNICGISVPILAIRCRVHRRTAPGSHEFGVRFQGTIEERFRFVNRRL